MTKHKWVCGDSQWTTFHSAYKGCTHSKHIGREKGENEILNIASITTTQLDKMPCDMWKEEYINLHHITN